MNDKIIYFNSEDFINFISFVKSSLIKAASKAAFSILLHVENNALICKAVDAYKYIEYKVELYPTDNMIIEPFAMSLNDALVLSKCSFNSKFAIRQHDDNFEFNIIGGWQSFKSLPLDLLKFVIDGKSTEIGKINSVLLRNTITFMYNYTQDYTYARDKYIQFSGTQALATSRLSYAITKGNYINMTLQRDDANALKLLLKDDFILSVFNVKSDIEQLMFIGPKFKLIIAAADISTINVQYMEQIQNCITVNCNDLYKLVTFANEYSASKHVIGLSIKNNTLQLNIKNTLSNNLINIESIIGNATDTKTEAEVPVANLIKALKLFQDKKVAEVNLCISDELRDKQSCILLFDKNTQTIINIFNR